MSPEERREAIELERETRHWTLSRWEQEYGDEWSLAQASIHVAADQAVDELLAEVSS